MSGGIRYRLSPEERNLLRPWLADSTKSEGLLTRLQNTTPNLGISLDDPELNIEVEEKNGELNFTLNFPIDNDLNPGNGRIYLSDRFVLSLKSLSLLNYERSFKPSHSQLLTSKAWEQRMAALYSRPLPTATDDEVRQFSQEILPRLHRPFPENFRKILDSHVAIFDTVFPILEKHNISMNPLDPQSGMRLISNDTSLNLRLSFVLDTDPKEGLPAEKNGRLHLECSFEIDPATHQLLKAKRHLIAQEPLNARLKKAYADLLTLPQPDPTQTAQKSFARAMLLDLKIDRGVSPPGFAKVPEAPPEGPWAPPSRRILDNLWRLSDQSPQFETRALLSLMKRPSAPAIGGFFKDDLSRRALHDAVDLLIKKDPQTSERIARWIEEQPLTPEIVPILKALAELSQNHLDQAMLWVRRADTTSGLQGQVERLIKRQIDKQNALTALKVLSTYVKEKKLSQVSSERAWGRTLWRGITGAAATDLNSTMAGAESLLEKLEAAIQNEDGKLKTTLESLPLQSGPELALRQAWLEDRGIQELLDLSQDPDSSTRHHALAYFIEQRLLMEEGLPATAKIALEAIPSDTPKTARLTRWLNGQAQFGEKIAMLGPTLVDELIAPTTIGSMVFSGGVASLGKFAFLARFGAQTRALRLGAEAAALAVEAPAFLYSDKILRSFLNSPDLQWDHPGKELVGAYFAFGVLRSASLGGQALNKYWAESQAVKKFAAGTTQVKSVERLLPFAEKFGTRGTAAQEFLKTLSQEGLSRSWTLPALQTTSTHLLGMGGLVLANQLSRTLGLRPKSPQGFYANLLDDFLMYGHFLASGSIAQRLNLRPLDPYNHFLEMQGQEKTPLSPSHVDESRATPASWRQSLARVLRSKAKVKIPQDAPSSPRKKLIERLPETWRLFLEEFLPFLISRPQGAKSTPTPQVEAPPFSKPEPAATPPRTEPATSDPAPETLPTPNASPPDGKPSNPAPAGPNGAPEPVDPFDKTPPSGTPIPPQLVDDLIAALPSMRSVTLPATFVEPNTAPDKIQPLLYLLPKSGKSDETWFLGVHSLVPEQGSAEFLLAQQLTSLTTAWAKLTRMKSGIPEGPFEGWQYYLEAMDPIVTPKVNGKVPKQSESLEDGDIVSFNTYAPSFIFRINPKTGEGALIQTEIRIGRAHRTPDPADVLFPAHERNISRKHAVIHFDPQQNRFVLSDTSEFGTIVMPPKKNPVSLYRNTSTPLGNGDEIMFGGSRALNEAGEELPLFFRPPEIPFKDWPVANAATTLSAGAPHPEVANTHPLLRNMAAAEREAYFLRLLADLNHGYIVKSTEDETLFYQVHIDAQTQVPRIEAQPTNLRTVNFDTMKDLAGHVSHFLILDQGQQIPLLPNRHAWVLGAHPQGDTNTLAIPLGPRAKAEAQLYFDAQGHLILKAQPGGEGIYLQMGFTDAFKPRLEKISDWTVLKGEERIYFGKDGAFFDLQLGSTMLPFKPKDAWSQSGTTHFNK